MRLARLKRALPATQFIVLHFKKLRIRDRWSGGIMTPEDALEFIIAGACAVQVGTANFVNPNACVEIIDGIEAYIVKNGFQHINELVGSLRIP